jgi:prepilin-type N-terminal cleavage/methylation domain-containing protein
MLRRQHRNMGGRIRTARGFTLLEILLTSAIVTVAVVGVLTSFVMGRVHTSLARHRVQAANLLREKIEVLRSNGYDYLNTMDPNPEVETGLVLDAGPDEESFCDDLTCTRTTRVADDDGDGALEIRVTVTWSERKMSGQDTCSESLFTIMAPTRLADR